MTSERTASSVPPPTYYDRQGQPIDEHTWATLFGQRGYKQVASEQVGDMWVSTIWLGGDHNWWSPGDPLIIFETMVFGGTLDQHTERYATEQDALAGHARIVEMAKQRLWWESDEAAGR